jgi:hypothetical protein
MAYEPKTKKNDADVEAFLKQTDEKRVEDVMKIHSMMEEITGEKAKMWGKSIVGYGQSSYKTADGKLHEWMATGFSPRKQNITLYIMPGFDRYEQLLEKLGKHSIGKSCLYIKKLSDIDETILREMIKKSVEVMRESDKENRK